jgi:PKD repeat protein
MLFKVKTLLSKPLFCKKMHRLSRSESETFLIILSCLLILLTSHILCYSQTLQPNPDSIPFAPAVNYGAGSHPASVFCADLDGDNDLDLAVANNDGGNVSILKNYGDGIFQTAVNYGAGSHPASVFCADLDGDNDLDLAVANDGGNVSILKNNGDGTFQTAVNYGAGSHPASVFCADLDGDNYLDLAVANDGGNNVSILKNNGDGTFASAVNYGAGSHPVSIFCADLDGDNYLDLAVANDGGNVSILKNNGDGTFQSAVNYGAGSHPASIFCANLDRDNYLDLAVANNGSNNVSILKNNGDETFQSAVNYGVGSHPASVFCGDLGGDTYIDLAVANAFSDNISILINSTNPPPDSFSLISPLNDDTVKTPIIFTWGRAIDPDSADSVRYDLYLSRSIVFDPDSTVVYESLLDTTFVSSLVGGLWYWKVKAYDNWGATRWSNQTWSFWIPSPPNPYSLLSPSDGEFVVSPVTLEWQTSSDVDPNDIVRYDLYLSRSAAFTPGSTVIYDSLTDTTFTDSLGGGLWYWKVKALDRWNLERWSNQTWSFHICSPSAGYWYWNFDENSGSVAHDFGGCGNDATIHGATWVTHGISGSALDFDGINDWAQANPVNVSYLTVSAWVYYHQFCENIGWGPPIVSNGCDNPAVGYHLYQNTNYPFNRATCFVTVGGQRYGTISDLPLVTGQWYNLAMTYDGHSVKLYINGRLDSEDDRPSGTITPSPYPLMFAEAYYPEHASWFNGLIDEVRIYNRALSADEIDSLYNIVLFANFRGEPTHGCVPLEVQFTDFSPGHPTSRFWDFGDGNTDTVQNPTHTYNDTGYYDVKLVVSNIDTIDSITKYDYIYVQGPDLYCGLVSYWNFDEGNGSILHDVAPGNTGAYDGTIYGATWTTGISGGALNFDGSDYVQFSTPVLNTPPYTFCAWVKASTLSFPSNRYILSNGGESTSHYGFYMLLRNTSMFEIGSKDVESYGGAAFVTATTDWVYLCCVWDGTYGIDKIKLYRNGNLEATANATHWSGNSPLDFCIGSPASNHTSYDWHGLIDEVCIYDRTLSADEIRMLYDKGLVGYWNFDEGSGDTLNDYSVYNNNGIINGASWTTGVSGSALEFVGENVVSSIPNSYDDQITSALTVTAWVKWYGSSHEDCIIFDGRGSSSEGLVLGIKHHDEKLMFNMNQGHSEILSIHSVPADTSWTHVAVVFDDSINLLRAFINGVQDDTLTTTVFYHNSSLQPAIGNANHGALNQPLNGILDEVRIYRIALSADSIKSLCRSISPTVIAPDSSLLLCPGDSLMFVVTATDPCPIDTLTLFGPGMSAPLQGVSPLSANVAIPIDSTGNYRFIYTVSDLYLASGTDTASWIVTINSQPAPFSLLSPAEKDSVRMPVTLIWHASLDSCAGQNILYELHLSRSSDFSPDSIVDDSISDTTYVVNNLQVKDWYWKARAYDKWGAERWSDTTWSFYVYLCGDCNADRVVDVGDVVYLINYLFKKGSAPVPFLAGDLNCNGVDDIGDVVYLINYLFKNGQSPCAECP